MDLKSILAALVIAGAVGYFIYRIIYLIRLLGLGHSEDRFDQITRRLFLMIKESILQFAQFRIVNFDYTYAGVMHILIIFGFLILLPGEIEFLLGGVIPGFDFSFLGHPLFNLFLLSQDILITAVIIGILMAFFRRFVMRPDQISYHFTAYLILGLILTLMITLMGINILYLVDPAEGHFAEAALKWMPVTNAVAAMLGISSGTYPIAFNIMWWLHLLVLLFFLDFIPHSKHLHVFAGIPANFFRHFPPPLVYLPRIDFDSEEVESFGVSKVEDFSWKQLFDGFTCTECGRCTQQCPANSTGKTLSPRDIVLSIKENLFINGSKLLATPKEELSEIERAGLIGDDFIREEELWQCTTCGACANVCPVGNEHLRDIIELRRYLMMEEGKSTELMSKAIKSLEARQHPFFGTGSGPKDWRKGLDVPIFEQGNTEYLLWIGCSATYEERAQNIGRAMVNILKKTGVSFGILKEARCTGDPAKQMGNDYLFEELAMQNIEEFESLGIKKIITLCPHCYHSFTHYYPELGGSFEVIPHAVFIDSLMGTGKLKLQTGSETVCYHDPCYLGRHNEILDEPRNVVSGTGKLVEMSRNKNASFCCGGGGGNYWAEEEGTRINQVRAGEAFDTQADKIATSCPFCLLMMTDGLKKYTEEQKAFDIAELIEMRMVS